MKKRIISTIMALITLCSTITIMPTTSYANEYYCTKSEEELETMFPEGRYWNHIGLKTWDITTTTTKPCTTTHKHGSCGYDGACGCNSFFGKASQCMGFVFALQYIAFNGYDGYSPSWYNNADYAMANLKSGDAVKYSGHWIFVTRVEGDAVYYMDCNGTGGGCIIRNDEYISKSTLKANFKSYSPAPCELTSNSVNRVNLYETAKVTAKSGLKIRTQPNINSAQAGTLGSGAIVNVCNYPITDSSGYTWRLLVDGRGWVCSNYLNILNGQSIVAGNYKIQAANGKYLSYVNYPKNDVNIVMYEDLTGTDLQDCQIWNFQPLYYFNDWGAIIYRISPIMNSNYSLDCDAGNNQALHLWEKLDISAQEWIVEIRSDGSMRILNEATRYALDIANASNDNNAEVITYPSHDGSNQRFFLVAP